MATPLSVFQWKQQGGSALCLSSNAQDVKTDLFSSQVFETIKITTTFLKFVLQKDMRFKLTVKIWCPRCYLKNKTFTLKNRQFLKRAKKKWKTVWKSQFSQIYLNCALLYIELIFLNVVPVKTSSSFVPRDYVLLSGPMSSALNNLIQKRRRAQFSSGNFQ